MSLIKLDGLNEVKEAQLAPEGMYFINVLRQMPKKTDKGEMVNLILEIESEEPGTEYANAFDTMSFPGPNDDQDKVNFKLLLIKRRLFWLGLTDSIQNQEIDPTDMVGQRTLVPCKVVQSTFEGKTKNDVQWPQLPDEE